VSDFKAKMYQNRFL